ncbi:P1 family peptidase [Collinsella tanakaei]|uniref:P1 family peptidase n=1 Tax=Collinsella tanakaei TaxID=626935 RepID=UPI0026F2768F|nr:P1 family peptidase [Collinsella tanakaei]
MSNQLEPININDIEGFAIGHWTNLQAGTGCTAIVAPQGATAGVDVRGAAPASRETDLLKPENTVDKIHAVMLSGGSAFGLEAASGAARELERRGIGLPVGPTMVPIVCSSCLFDLAFADPFTRPDIEAGILSVACALDNCAPGSPVPEGNVGAGCGATVGKLLGPDHAMKGGLGARAFQLGQLKVGAISAVNACGNVVDPETLKPIAGARATPDGTQIIDMEEAALEAAADMKMPLDRTNTTISCIITNASLTKAQATKVAQMAADAYAHTIRPTHTTNDGDTIYVMASYSESVPDLPLDLIGLVATRALEAAICSGCATADGLGGLPSAKDIAQ